MTPLPSGSNSEGTLPEKPAATPPPPAEPAVVLEIEVRCGVSLGIHRA